MSGDGEFFGNCECPVKGCSEVATVTKGKRRLTVDCPVHSTVMMQGKEGQALIRSLVDDMVSKNKQVEEPETIEVETMLAPEEKKPRRWSLYR